MKKKYIGAIAIAIVGGVILLSYFYPRAKETNPTELSRYFSDRPIDRAVLTYVEGVLLENGPAESHDYLTAHSIEMIDAIAEAYPKLPENFVSERQAMMETIFEILQNVKNTRASADRAKGFFSQIIEAGHEDLDVQLVAARHFFLYEGDEGERKRIANLILARDGSPEVRDALNTLMEEVHPDKLWIGRNIKAEEAK